MKHPAALPEFAASEEFRAALRYRFLRFPARLKKKISFIDEVHGEPVSEVVCEFEPRYKEAAKQALAESFAIYAQRFVPIVADLVDKIAESKVADYWHRASQEICTLISEGVPFVEEIEVTEGTSASEQGSPTLTRSHTVRCSDEESVACLVQCGSDPSMPRRQGVAGFVLCAFADISEGNLALVVEQQGLPPILAALRDNSGVCDLRETALDFLEKAVDPGGSHAGETRAEVASFAGSDAGLIPAVLGAMKAESAKAVAVISGLVKADHALFAVVAECGGLSAMLAAQGCLGKDAKGHAQVLDVLRGLVDATSALGVAKAAVQAMRDFPTNIKVLMSGIGVLHSCVPLLKPDRWKDLAGCGEAVVGCMKLCRGVPQAQKSGCSILRAVASSASWPTEGSGASGACAVLTGAAQKFAKVSGLLEDVVAVLTAMARAGPEPVRDAARGGVEVVAAVVAAASGSSGSTELSASVKALQALTANSESSPAQQTST